jgi:hypothetical protein
MAKCLAPPYGLTNVPLNYNVACRLGYGQCTYDTLDLAHCPVDLTSLLNSTNGSVNDPMVM